MDLIQHLVKKKIINKKEEIRLRDEVKKKGKKQEEIILDEKIIEEKELFNLKSKLFEFPLKEKIVKKISPEILSIIPRESIEFYRMIPLAIDREKKVLEVGMVFPEDPQAKEALKFLTRQHKLESKIFLITLSDFNNYLKSYQVPEMEVEKALERLEEEIKEEAKRKDVEKEEFERLVEEAPIIKMVAVILRQAVEGKASDIHIEPTRESLRVRFRLDGVLYPSLVLPLKIRSAVVARIKILGGLKIDETRLPQDGRFSTVIGDRRIDFRVSSFPTELGEKVAIRILDPEKGIKSLDKLGLQNRDFKIVEEAIKNPYGIILVTGPTGCGKTTTLYTILRMVNKEGVNIVTLEDPVEYYISGVNQSQVNQEINFTFARGLRQLLRQDPDIVMVGEIRDEETAALAIHAGLTGHLVLSTLHTNNAAGAIPRLIDMAVKSFLIPTALSIVISQRLIKVLCKECKERVKLQGEQKKYILDKIKTLPKNIIAKKIEEPLFIYKANGCKKCNFKGYSGRIGVFEIIKMTPKLAEIIIEKPSEGEIIKEAKSQGMISMEKDGILKVLEGITSLEEIMRITEE